ncbi:MAG: hypothetical protein Q6363_009775 [Candidatus Njordarchaeota archaeon]
MMAWASRYDVDAESWSNVFMDIFGIDYKFYRDIIDDIKVETIKYEGYDLKVTYEINDLFAPMKHPRIYVYIDLDVMEGDRYRCKVRNEDSFLFAKKLFKLKEKLFGTPHVRKWVLSIDSSKRISKYMFDGAELRARIIKVPLNYKVLFSEDGFGLHYYDPKLGFVSKRPLFVYNPKFVSRLVDIIKEINDIGKAKKYERPKAIVSIDPSRISIESFIADFNRFLDKNRIRIKETEKFRTHLETLLRFLDYHHVLIYYSRPTVRAENPLFVLFKQAYWNIMFPKTGGKEIIEIFIHDVCDSDVLPFLRRYKNFLETSISPL